ncbi:hypothetical protein Tco_0832669 [Tanacetum coccineum]
MVDKRGGRKNTVWEELVEKFFCKFYPQSYDGEEEMLDEGDNWGIDPLEFISRINSSFDKHIDGRTKKVLFHAWKNGSWNKRQMNDRILSNNNTIADSFFKPYLITHGKYDTEKEDEQRGGYRAAAPGFYQRNNANPSYQERRQSIGDTLSKFMSESTKRHEENSNLIKEIRTSTDAAIQNQGSSIKTLEIQIGQMSKVLQERGFGSLPSSTEANPRDQVKSISTTIEADSYPIRRIGSSQYAVSTGQNRTLMYETRQTTIPFLSHLNGYYCEEKKGSYGPQFSEAYSEASQSIP